MPATMNGEAVNIKGGARDINGSAVNINGGARDINGSAVNINGGARDINGKELNIKGGGGTINAKAATINKTDHEPEIDIQSKLLTQSRRSDKVKKEGLAGRNVMMKPIEIEKVQQLLEGFINKDVYIHLETTNGAYAGHFNKANKVGAYIRNAKINFSQAKIIGDGHSYRAGLKTEMGWVYAEGLTDWTIHKDHQLLMAGHDHEGRLTVALHISETPLG